MKDIAGFKYGRLTVIKPSHVGNHATWFWECQCDCGKTVKIDGDHLRSGNTKSCGCSRRNDLTMKVFGRLTAISPTHKDKHKRWHWLCKCDCGNEKIICGESLKKGYSKNCGCAPGKKGKDLLGQKFGRLTVVAPSHTTGAKGWYWICRCDCGGKKVVRGSYLLAGGTKSCGCLHPHILPIGVSAFNVTYKTYMRGATKRGLAWGLSEKFFMEITQKDCYYCGSPPSNTYRNSCNRGDYIYSGIDRIDNSAGYTTDNVVPCCITCNVAKHAQSKEEFLDLIKKIYSNLNL